LNTKKKEKGMKNQNEMIINIIKNDDPITENDPPKITEIVFVTPSSLHCLLFNSINIFVLFLSPDDNNDEAFTSSKKSQCPREECVFSEIYYSEDIALGSIIENDDRHLYWKNQSSCKQNKCIN
jgi:hypothetical protein